MLLNTCHQVIEVLIYPLSHKSNNRLYRAVYFKVINCYTKVLYTQEEAFIQP